MEHSGEASSPLRHNALAGIFAFRTLLIFACFFPLRCPFYGIVEAFPPTQALFWGRDLG